MSDQVIDEVRDTSPDQLKKANPFPGLRPFKIDESHLFFGREGQSDEVLLKLSKNRFVGVIGPSGSGKSSFIYCGVLPILYGGFLTNTSPNWEVIVTRPGAAPIDNLAASILDRDPDYVVSGKEDRQIKDTIVTTLLKSSSLGLVEAIMQSKRDADKNYLVLVDQFEELFRFKDRLDKDSINETLAFVNLLVEAINYADAPIYVAITMRSDFIGDCAQFPDLTKKINDSHYLIPQMTRDQKRKAITGPVAVGGAEITPRLIQQLLNDLGDNPDQLPILQHSLMRTWSYWSNFGDLGEPIDLKHYEAIGTMREALSLHANEAYDELDEDQQRICETLFKAITEKRGENFGIRRPTRLSEIASIIDVSDEDVIEVIEKFREPGRSLLTPAAGIPLTGSSIVDISHESLMRIWVRLKNWVDEEAEAVQMYLRLAEAAGMYQVGKAGLWRPPDLQLALNWQVKHKPTLIWGQRYHPAFERTMVFLEYSKKEYDTEQRIKELQRKRQLQRARVTALVLATATVISLLFLLYAFQQKTEADKARDAAEEQRIEAVSNAEKAKIAEAAALEQQKLAEEAADEARRQEQIANEQKLAAQKAQEQAEIQRQSAIQSAQIAREQEAIAKEKEKEANEAKDEADVKRQEALVAKARADKLRYQAIASAMAIKSTQLGREQRDLKGLLAQQAYLFNVEYEGKVYDNDVYNGLYDALKIYDDPLVRDLGDATHGHNKGVYAMASVQEGNDIYTGGTEGKILKWSLNGLDRVADTLVMARGASHIINSIAISESKGILISGGNYPKLQNSTFVEIIDLNGGEMQKPRELKGFNGNVKRIITTKDGSGAYVLDNGGTTIKYTDFNNVTEVLKTSTEISDIALTADGSTIIAADRKGVITKYEVTNNMKAEKVFDNKERIYAMAVSTDNQIAIGQQNGMVKLFSMDNTERVTRLVGHSSWINQIKFSPNGKFIATASNDKSVRLWNRDNLTDQPIILPHLEEWAKSVSFTPDNQQVLVGTQDRQVKVYPTLRDDMSGLLCEKYLRRNMTEDEWDTYVATDIDDLLTCSNLE